jgi:hypothetical protein
MKVGYGRGYYGVGQLAPKRPPPRGGGGWIKFAVVVGVGAVVWYMWPRSSKLTPGFGGGEPKPPGPPALPPSPPDWQFKPLDQGGQLATSVASVTPDSLDQSAEARGYPTQKAYEDAVVESARQLQDAGAKVSFAPHLQHLAPRLLPP